MRHVLAVALFLLAATQPALAQTQITSGVIQGTVMDATGGALPGATVEVKNLDTNVTQHLTTDAAGRYVALQLPSGNYTVTITLKGFTTLILDGIVLTVGQSINLPTRLNVSTVEQRVTVTGTPIVETTRSGVATTLDEKTVSTLPILGRKFEDFLTLTPGVSVV